jgi:hypothetical protein
MRLSKAIVVFVGICILALSVPAAMAASELPRAARRDAKLEKEMVAIMTALWKQDKVLKAIIIEKDWSNETAQVRGRPVVVARRITAKVASKVQSGKCRIFDIVFRQAKSGGSFGKTEYHSVGDSEDIPCENVK